MEGVKERLRRLGVWAGLHRRELIGVICVLIAVFAVGAPALANDPPGTGSVNIAEKIALWLATIFAWIAQQVVKLIVVLIDIVIVPIMQYSNFTEAQVVRQGWTVVRDLVNMFFVVILLIIAFQTIFNLGRADWKRQVPRLLIMAVVINFSRTIAGILIDFGQVIMFTFVNAIADVAGGNFIQLFGLDKLFTYSSDQIATTAKNGVGIEVFDFFGAAFLTMVLTFIILATMVILAGLLAFRIVILWCLVIISPLTFFLGGAKGVVGPAESYYADWWKRFTGAVALGPILTFFVWLALAAASTGNLSEKQGFVQQTGTGSEEAASIGGHITKAFDAPHLTSLIVAIALLFAGFEVSQSTASSMGGRAGAMASSAVKGIPGLAKSLARVGVPVGMAAGVAGTATVGLGAAGVAGAAYGGGLLGGVGLGAGLGVARVVSGKKGAYLTGKEKVGATLRDVGTAIAQVPGANVLGLGAVGRRVATAGTGLVQGVEHAQEHDLAEAQKNVAGMDTASRLSMVDALKGSGRYQDQVALQAIITSSLLSKDTMTALSPEQRQDFADIWYTQIAGKADDATKDKVGKMLEARPELASGQAVKDNPQMTGDALAAERQKEVNKQVGTNYTKRSDIAKVKTDSVRNKMVREAFRQTKIGDDTIESLILTGKYGSTELRKAYAEAMESDRGERRDSLRSRVQEVATGSAAVTGATTPETRDSATTALNSSIAKLAEEVGKLSAEDIVAGVVTPEMFEDARFVQSFDEKASPATKRAINENTALRGKYFDVAEAESDALVEKADAATTEDKARMQSYARTAAETGFVPGYDSEAGQFRDAGNATDSDEVKANQRNIREQAFKDMIVNNPTVVASLGLKEADLGKQIGLSIAEAMEPPQIDVLVNRAMNTTGVEQARVIDALRAIKAALIKNSEAISDSAERISRINLFQRKTGRG